MFKFKGLFLAGLAATALLSSTMSRAETITQHWNFTNSGSANDYFNYDLFNSNLGTLTNVRFRLVNTNTADVRLYNLTGSSQDFTNASTAVTVDIFGPPSGQNYISDTITSTVASGTADIGFNDYPGFSATHDVTQYVDSGLFSNYQAAGGGVSANQLQEVTSDYHSSVSAPIFVFAGGGGTTTADLYLYYDYTSSVTPEPGTIALAIASGAVSFVGLRRRRHARK